MPITQMGQTPSGRMAALKILHPNGECDEYTTKFPDGCANTTIALERRDEFKISCPSGTVEGNWNCIIMDIPFFVMTQIAIRWDAKVTPTDALLNLAAKSVMEAPGFKKAQYPAFVPGRLTDFDFEYSILGASELTPRYRGSKAGVAVDIKQMRRTYMGVTIDLDANSLADQGRVVYGQWKPDVTLATAYNNSVEPPPVVKNTYNLQTPAMTINNIVQSDELCYQAEAKHGLYAPIRTAEFDLPMTAAQEWRAIEVYYPGEDPGFVEPGDEELKDLWLRGWLIGTSHWSDLDHTASLRIKRKEGLELISAPAGVYAAFASMALPNDLRAMQIIQEFSRREPHGYPADYNELGTMLQKIIGGISGAVADLGLPVISDVAHTVHKTANGKIGQLLTNLLDEIA